MFCLALNAKTFLEFGDICEGKCKNDPKEVELVQKILNIGSDKKIKITKKYDKATKEAIIAFQKEHNIPATGYVGELTKVALETKFKYYKSMAEDKVAKMGTPKFLTQSFKPIRAKESTSKEKTTKVSKKEKIDSRKFDFVDKKLAVKEKVAAAQPLKLSKKEIEKIKKRELRRLNKKIAAKRLKLKRKKSKDYEIASVTPLKSKMERRRGKSSSFEEFKKYTDLKKSYKVFKDYKLLRKANGKNTIVKINVRNQRVNLIVDGKVALSSPCTTGAKRKFEPNTKIYRDKRTPLGTFRVLEKIADKRSTIFGEIIVDGKVVYRGDRRKYKGPPGKFVGHPLTNWVRLTSGGIGLHASKYVKRYPASNGCIRLPYDVSKIIFAKVSKGTKVMVVNEKE
ncbi:MAG: murein L,D-transpeptidase [Epsilonproteobacteria bacterium]|nr:murein L,D-transpeptidase [Campylobacterota bacterium]